ncbi:hypothetical protein [Burkholderia gladioli]|uniref:hypothetical protein n=1 Tax=Burkholderia gladioli TaxID=28095 RepID=UPI001C27973E|nr:hypothetical protein [Burkholderia gladioli]MBU9378739.1 hypothetical protein [Burkholderia gladioli]
MSDKLKEGHVWIEVVAGREGPSLNIGDDNGGYRLSGPKPWGGGRTVHRFMVRLDELVREANDLAASPAPAINMPPLNNAMRAVLTNENCIYGTPDELYAALVKAAPAISESEDAARLNWLDATNKRFRMGWSAGVAPAGNCRLQTIIQPDGNLTSVREAIDAARKGEKS